MVFVKLFLKGRIRKMTTYEKIKEEIKVAMRSKDSNKLLALRSLDSQIKNISINNLHKDGPTEDDVVSALSQLIKRGTDSSEQFKKAGREDLFQTESFQVDLFKTFLPEQLSKEELKKSVGEDLVEIVSESETLTNKDFGRLMKIFVPKYKGKCDGKELQEVLKEFLNVA